ncbi:MAG TPA: hypothetical protein VJI12_00530 [archaeon]|nr:hypothetical protein [archaeon]
MRIYEDIVKPAVFLFDPELTHTAILTAGQIAGSNPVSRAAVDLAYHRTDSGLTLKLGRVTYPSPAGLAAGYDKYGHLVNIMPHMSAGHEEFGTVTPSEREGNPKKRLFRLPLDHALINRMGLNNYGLVKSAQMLDGMDFGIPLDISFDPNVFFIDDKDATQIRARYDLWRIPYAKKINVSCPNTKDGKAYETPDGLDKLLGRIDGMCEIAQRDVYVKFSHDLTDERLGELIDVCGDHNVVGFVIGNTSNSRHGLRTPAATLEQIGNGGLSGAPLMQRKLKMVEYTRKKTNGRSIIQGVGGIGCDPHSTPAQDVYNYLLAGAHTTQVLTGIPYRGIGIFRDVNEKLAGYMKAYGSLEDFMRRRG